MRQPYRIESVTLKDIGVFEHTHFDFPPIQSELRDGEKAEIHIFTGPNGCGKSTVLYALAAIFDPFNNKHPISKRFLNGYSLVDFKFGNGHGFYCVNKIDTSLFIDQDYLINPVGKTHYYGDKNFRDLIKNYAYYFDIERMLNDTDFQFAAFAYSGNTSHQDQFVFDSIKEIEYSPFENALSFYKTIRSDVIAQWIANNLTKYALAKIEQEDEEANKYQESLGKIKAFIFNLSGIKIDFKLSRSPLSIVFNIDDKCMAFDSLPEGLKSIIGWVCDLAIRLEYLKFEEKKDIFSQPLILFLDEIDIHLHPKWQRRILPAIQKLLPNSQVFVSTHSPFVVGSVEDAWVYRLPDPQRNVMRDASMQDQIVPTESGAGKSIQLILEEIFDVDERFDVETEQLLKSFKKVRNRYLQNPTDDSELMDLAQTIRERGEELETIIEMELRQIARRSKK